MGKVFFRVVSFGGAVAGAGRVFESHAMAYDALFRARIDTGSARGRYRTDPAVMAHARVYGYSSRKAAKVGSISDDIGQAGRVE